MHAPVLGRNFERVEENLASRARVATRKVAEKPTTDLHHGIASVPTLLLFRNGRVVAQVVGLAYQRAIEETPFPKLG